MTKMKVARKYMVIITIRRILTVFLSFAITMENPLASSRSISMKTPIDMSDTKRAEMKWHKNKKKKVY